jgi:hypothetical protein
MSIPWPNTLPELVAWLVAIFVVLGLAGVAFYSRLQRRDKRAEVARAAIDAGWTPDSPPAIRSYTNPPLPVAPISSYPAKYQDLMAEIDQLVATAKWDVWATDATNKSKTFSVWQVTGGAPKWWRALNAFRARWSK